MHIVNKSNNPKKHIMKQNNIFHIAACLSFDCIPQCLNFIYFGYPIFNIKSFFFCGCSYYFLKHPVLVSWMQYISCLKILTIALRFCFLSLPAFSEFHFFPFALASVFHMGVFHKVFCEPWYLFVCNGQALKG